MEKISRVEAFPNLVASKEPATVYDVACKSIPELVYLIMQRLNETIEHMNKNDATLQQQLDYVLSQLEDFYLKFDENLRQEIQIVLQAWIEDGTLEQVISQLVENRAVYSSIPALQQAPNIFQLGAIVELQGYHYAGDGAGHKRVISATDDGSGVRLYDKFANLIVSNAASILDVGATEEASDNSELIQKLLDCGHDVIVPKGVYKTKQLTIKFDDQKITGVGTLKLIDSQYSPVIYANGKTKAIVCGVKIDGNAKGNPLDNGAYTINGTLVSSQDTGVILLENCQDSTVELVKVENAHSTPIVLKNCKRSDILNCISKNHLREGFGIVGGKNCTINDCHSYFEGGLATPWSLIFTSGIEGDGGKHQHKIINNICENSQAAFITVNTEDTDVQGNIVLKTADYSTASGPGIRLGHADSEGKIRSRAHRANVRNNFIKNINSAAPFSGNSRGISCDNATDSVVEDNTIIGCLDGVGVSVTASQSIVIKNNTIKDTSQKAIDLYNADGCVVSGNVIQVCATGIKKLGANTIIEGNFVKSYTSKGIELAYGGSVGLTGNVVRNNTVVGDVTTNYLLAGATSNIYKDNFGTSDVHSSVIFVTSKPTTTAFRKGTIAFLETPISGEDYSWVCIDQASGNWSAVQKYGIKQLNGKFVASGDGTAKQILIPHTLGRAAKFANVSSASNNAAFANISYIRAFTNSIEVNFTNALPNGTNNIELFWTVEG